MRSEEELHEHLESRLEPVFDLDTYRIVARFLEASDSALDIVPLGKSVLRQMELALPA